MIRYVNVFLYTVMVVMNYLANALPINNLTTGELSDLYPNLFVPAGITFSIWGIIYVLLLGYCIIQFTSYERTAVVKSTVLFALSCIFNTSWIFAWHYQKLQLSILIMVCLLLTLIFINILIRNNKSFLVKAAFGIYLGWICIATIANVTALLVDIGWEGGGIPQDIWTMIMIGTGALIACFSIIQMRNPYIGLAVIWAFAGIIIKRQDDYRSIVIAAVISIIIVAAITIAGFFRKSPLRKSTSL